MAGNPTTSSYVRVERHRATPTATTVDVAGEVLFIDVVAERAGGWEGEVADQLRFVDEDVIDGRRHLILRAPTQPSADGIATIERTIAARTRGTPAIATIDFPFDLEGPQLSWLGSVEPTEDDDGLIQLARATETAALLHNGKAHWRPLTFHYELPSGRHRADFIRVGDALRTPRDATVLATWLHQYVDTGRAVLLDSSTIMPLAHALEIAARDHGRPLGPIAVRDAYPDSLLTDQELIELTVGANGAIALVTVSSTGHTVDALSQALQTKAPDKWWIETIVDRSGENHSAPPPRLNHPWHCIPDQGHPGDDCELCRDPAASPVVRIDPGSFANTALTEPAMVVMPAPPWGARQIANLLDMYDEVDGIGIDCDPAARTRMRRQARRWGVRFYPHKLLTHPDLTTSLTDQLNLARGDANDGRIDVDKLQGIDAIAVLDEDHDAEGFERVITWVTETFADHDAVPIARLSTTHDDESATHIAATLATSSHILVLTVGTVTGGTLAELLIRIHRALSHRPRDDYQISGLVLHARPPTYREWQSTRSAYSQRLVAMWMTYLPNQDHPLAEEQRLYRSTLNESSLTEHAATFAAQRRQWVLNNPNSDWIARKATWDPAAGGHNPAAVLLCSNPAAATADLPRLLPNSLFGHRMSMVGTLVGVGAALHRQRLEHEAKGGPPGLKFDLSRIPAVYFEVPILTSVLRWLRPYEACWEYPDRPAEDVLRDMWHKTQFEEEGSRETLLAELALAAAAGKLPRHTKPIIDGFAADLSGATDITAGALGVALSLMAAAWSPTNSEDSPAGARQSPS